VRLPLAASRSAFGAGAPMRGREAMETTRWCSRSDALHGSCLSAAQKGDAMRSWPLAYESICSSCAARSGELCSCDRMITKSLMVGSPLVRTSAIDLKAACSAAASPTGFVSRAVKRCTQLELMLTGPLAKTAAGRS
jgi:hypothetical protein